MGVLGTLLLIGGGLLIKSSFKKNSAIDGEKDYLESYCWRFKPVYKKN